jgi:hypothetical protein
MLHFQLLRQAGQAKNRDGEKASKMRHRVVRRQSKAATALLLIQSRTQTP